MCGRYQLAATVEQVAARFGVELGDAGQPWQPRYNMAPSQANPVVVARAEDRELAWMQWGLVPAWSKTPKMEYSTINARVETVAEKATYRTPLRRQRCLVPATAYYEWQAALSTPTGRVPKQPYCIQFAEGEGPGPLFAFAGLYDIWRGPDGQELATYTILTMAANERLAPIHDRMPVILPRAAEDSWLDPALADPARLLADLVPYPAEAFTAFPISLAVNSPANDGPEVVQR